MWPKQVARDSSYSGWAGRSFSLSVPDAAISSCLVIIGLSTLNYASGLGSEDSRFPALPFPCCKSCKCDVGWDHRRITIRKL